MFVKRTAADVVIWLINTSLIKSEDLECDKKEKKISFLFFFMRFLCYGFNLIEGRSQRGYDGLSLLPLMNGWG